MSTISGASNKMINKLLQPRKDSKASVQDLSKYDFIVGDKVFIASNPDRLGTVVFNGLTRFSDGIWIGVALDLPFGKNNGVVQGVKYFQCEENHGIFVRPNNLRYASEKKSNAIQSTNDINTTEEQLNNSNLQKESNEISFAEPFPVSITTSNLNLGDRVYVAGKSSNSMHKNGILRFLGYTKFSEGIWAGIELDNPVGKNDGSVNGVRYFSCKPQYGLFALEVKIKKLDLSNMKVGYNRMDCSKFGSSESVSSIASNFSSASRTRVRLGMNAVNNTPKFKGDKIMENSADKTKSTKINVKDIKDSDRASTAIQNVLKEKEQHVEQLIREREIERIDLATATAKIDELEKYQARHFSSFNDQKLIYDTKLNELQNAMYLVCQERDHLSEKLDEEKRKVEDLMFRIEEKDIDESDLENKTEENESHIFELNEKLAAERELREHLESKLKASSLSNAKDANETTYITQIKTLERKLLKIQSELNEEKNNSKLKSLAALLEEKESAVNDLQDRFGEAKSHLSASKKEIDSLKKLQINHNDEIKSLKNEIAELQNFIRDLNEKLSEIRKEERSKIVKESNQNTQSRDEFIQTEEIEDYIISSQTKEMSDLKDNLEIIMNENGEIKSELMALKEEFDLHHRKSEEKRLECNGLQEKCNKLELEILEKIKFRRAVVEENDKLSLQLYSNLEQLEKLRTQLSELLSDNKKLMESKAEIENNEKTFRTELSKLKSQIISLQKDKEMLTKSLNESENDATRNSQILQMSVKIDDFETSIQQLNALLKTEKDQNMMLITKNATLYSDLEHLRQMRDDKDNLMYDQLQSFKSINELLENDKLSLLESAEAKNKELIMIRDRLLKTSQEHESLQESYSENNQKLEREKRLLNDKIRKLEKQFDENEKKSQLALSESTTDKRRSENKDQISLLKAAKENSEQQISFLNNVIIDREKKMNALQIENKILENKIKDIQNGNILPQSKPTKIITLRLYCDTCEIFDSHDTENCPMIIDESTPSSPQLIIRTVRKIPKAPRLYCDICEIFDSHDTDNCQDQLTF